jgi:hypothetical protein
MTEINFFALFRSAFKRARQASWGLLNPASVRAIPSNSGRIAQLVEQLTLNQRVQGSSPCAPTNEIKSLSWFSKRHRNQLRQLDKVWDNELRGWDLTAHLGQLE